MMGRVGAALLAAAVGLVVTAVGFSWQHADDEPNPPKTSLVAIAKAEYRGNASKVCSTGAVRSIAEDRSLPSVKSSMHYRLVVSQKWGGPISGEGFPPRLNVHWSVGGVTPVPCRWFVLIKGPLANDLTARSVEGVMASVVTVSRSRDEFRAVVDVERDGGFQIQSINDAALVATSRDQLLVQPPIVDSYSLLSLGERRIDLEAGREVSDPEVVTAIDGTAHGFDMSKSSEVVDVNRKGFREFHTPRVRHWTLFRNPHEVNHTSHIVSLGGLVVSAAGIAFASVQGGLLLLFARRKRPTR